MGLTLFLLSQQIVPLPEPDWLQEGVNAITLLAPAIARILTWGALLFLSRVPTLFLPVVGVLLGMGYDAIDGLLWTHPLLVVIKNLVIQFTLREILDKYFLKPFGLTEVFTRVAEDGRSIVRA